MSQTIQLVLVLGIVICIFGAFLGPGFGKTAMGLGALCIGGALLFGWILERLIIVFAVLVMILVVWAIFSLLRWLFGGRRHRNHYRDDYWRDGRW